MAGEQLRRRARPEFSSSPTTMTGGGRGAYCSRLAFEKAEAPPNRGCCISAYRADPKVNAHRATRHGFLASGQHPGSATPAIIRKMIGRLSVHPKRRNDHGGSFQFDAVAEKGEKKHPLRVGAVVYGGLT